MAAVIYGAIKGVAIGATTLAVVSAHGLTTFEKALILTLLSGGIGIFGMFGAAYINSRANAQMVLLTRENRELTEHNHKLLTDLAAAQGVARRHSDPT